MEVNAEARRILAVSISKLYASRSQRGGLRLHRSLLVSLVMKSARDIYHSSAAAMEKAAAAAEASLVSTEEAMEAMDTAEQQQQQAPENQPSEDKENQSPNQQRPSRKRPGKVSAVPDFLPEKRARLEPGEERHEAPVSPNSCRGTLTETLSALPLNRVVIAAF
uniref:Immediate early response 2b n=1 Tax=Neogobius melanostomus TaxID=47308 RepID=A0A8C6WVB1_9GOBI